MTDAPFALSALNLQAVADAPMNGPPFTPALIVGLCVAAGLMSWLALPSKKEVTVRRIGAVGLGAVGLVGAAMLVRWTVDAGGMGVYFWLFSAVALFASVRVITHDKPVYSALYFVLTVFATGGLFVLLWAEFIAAALVLIYAGAILITYVFVIMLASEAVTGGAVGDSSKLVSDHDAVSRDPFWAAMTGFAVAGLLVFLVFDESAMPKIDRAEFAVASNDHAALATIVGMTGAPAEPASSKPAELMPDLGSAQALGRELLENQAVNVQMAGVILTVAMVGAITLARRRIIVTHPDGQGTGGHETVHTPATPVDDNPHSIAVYGTDNPRHKAYPEN